MTPVGPPSPVPPVDLNGAPSLSAQTFPDSALDSTRDAFGSEAGIAVCLLASLPPNLGQTIDSAA